MNRAVDRMRLRNYLAGLTALGEFGTGGAPSVTDYAADGSYGPLSPEDLSKLDRALTPVEQKAVDDWQNADADKQLAAVRKQGGPRSSTVSVTSKGAVVRADPTPPPAEEPSGLFGLAWWQLGLIGIGVTAIGVGAYEAVTG